MNDDDLTTYGTIGADNLHNISACARAVNESSEIVTVDYLDEYMDNKLANIETMLKIVSRDLDMEEKYTDLAAKYEEYHTLLEQLTTLEILKAK